MTPFARILVASFGAATIAGCATVAADTDYRQAALALIRQDFRSAGPATVERIAAQDESQQLCSQYPKERPPEVAARIEAAQLAAVKQPADGKYLGKWQEGEKIAQNGRGMQSSDAIGAVNGGNCYACHQITKKEISFGNIGPSLYQYGKLRGNSDEIVKYTWNKLYNAQAYSACSNMPRFGHNGVLSEAQLKDVMALLLDPKSPVNE
ncbi:MAG TPA: sulfur oxidation c-type cytochrome SoxX [Telluria sp.]|jgi:sulfur-oxidizing protein SoxX